MEPDLPCTQPDETEKHVLPSTNPRNPIACEPCRTSKTRCYPSGQTGVCQRCSRAWLKCVSRSVQHPRRTKKLASLPSQKAETKEKSTLDSLSSQTSHKGEDSEFYLILPSLDYPDPNGPISSLISRHQKTFDQELSFESFDEHDQCENSSAGAGLIPASLPAELPPSSASPVIEQRTLKIDVAKESLSQITARSKFFPFVVVPQATSARMMARHHPFLLLAVLVVTSEADVLLHHQLDHEFRRVLSLKVIVEGQRSIDYLQGILVYIAWYPAYLKANYQQLFTYLNLAISLAVDLGLHQSSQQTNSSYPIKHTSEGFFSFTSSVNAAQRAYLGCFYLSSSIADIFSKPNPLRDSEQVLAQYRNSLTASLEFDSDLFLPSLVIHEEYGEQMRSTIQSRYSKDKVTTTVPQDVEMSSRSFQAELDTWTTSLPPDIKLPPIITLTERFIKLAMHCHNPSLLHSTRWRRKKLASSTGRLSVADLSSCLDAVKMFLEHSLSISATEFRYMTVTTWGRLTQVIVALSRLSFPIPSCPDWDAHAARESVPLVMYLDCLCQKLQSLSQAVSHSSEVTEHPDTTFLFKAILEKLKESHERRVFETTPDVSDLNVRLSNEFCTPNSISSTGSQSMRRCPMADRELTSRLDEWQFSSYDAMISGTAHSSPVTSAITSSTPVYHDIWATMTVNWAKL